jgi:hypothetical protein
MQQPIFEIIFFFHIYFKKSDDFWPLPEYIYHGVYEIPREVLPPDEAVPRWGELAPEGMQGNGDKLDGGL